MYCTVGDILYQVDEKELIQLTDDEDLGSINESVVLRAILDASSLIDSYCAGRYRIPFLPVPEIVRQLCVDITVYHLYSRRGDAVPENRKARFDNALKLLDRIAKGLIILGAPGSVEAGSVKYVSTERVFKDLREF